jgi:hypothetical protein
MPDADYNYWSNGEDTEENVQNTELGDGASEEYDSDSDSNKTQLPATEVVPDTQPRDAADGGADGGADDPIELDGGKQPSLAKRFMESFWLAGRKDGTTLGLYRDVMLLTQVIGFNPGGAGRNEVLDRWKLVLDPLNLDSRFLDGQAGSLTREVAQRRLAALYLEAKQHQRSHQGMTGVGSGEVSTFRKMMAERQTVRPPPPPPYVQLCFFFTKNYFAVPLHASYRVWSSPHAPMV